MKLQKATRYALYAILELAANPDRYLSVSEIADKHHISTNHLAKVLRDLGRAGLVESVRGAGGGYQFSANARRTTLYDVIRLFEDLREDSRRVSESGEGAAAGKALCRVLREIEDLAEATLESITLDTMLKLVSRERETADDAQSRPAAAGSGRR